VIGPKLLVSIFNPEEVRQAIAGGADIIDCEDPRVVMGFYQPHTITAIAHAVRQNEGATRSIMSVNIGAELTLFSRTGTGFALARIDTEVQARAAQQSLGIASAMDVGDRRANIIKFGVGGVPHDKVSGLVAAVKSSVQKHSLYQNHTVIAGFMPFDWKEWERRKTIREVIIAQVRVGEYYMDPAGSLDLSEYFKDPELSQYKLGANHTKFELTSPPIPQSLGFPEAQEERMKMYVDLIKAGGADGVMMDTPIHAKNSRICLVNHPQNDTDTAGGTAPRLYGLFRPDVLQKFANYCAFNNLESWLAGSISVIHAEVLGKMENLDVVLCRGSASEVISNPFGGAVGGDRAERRVTARKVSAMIKALRG